MTGFCLTGRGTAFSKAPCQNLLKQTSWEVPRKSTAALPTAHLKHVPPIICLRELGSQIWLPLPYNDFSPGGHLPAFILFLKQQQKKKKKQNKTKPFHF